MAKTDEEDKVLVREYLASAGLELEDVPESTVQRCDLHAVDGEHARYLFEVKGFHDAIALGSALRNGKDYSESLSFDTARKVQSGIHEAMKQLESTAQKGTNELRFLALLVRSKYDMKVFFQQIVGSFTVNGVSSSVRSLRGRTTTSSAFISHTARSSVIELLWLVHLLSTQKAPPYSSTIITLASRERGRRCLLAPSREQRATSRPWKAKDFSSRTAILTESANRKCWST